MSSFINNYEVLGVESDASYDDIRKAYRKKALETHPDKLDPNASEVDKQQAEKEFHKVYEAFEILGDVIKRKAYDTRLKARNNPSRICEEAVRRVKERREWAQRQQEEKLNRITEQQAQLHAQLQREKRVQEEALANCKKREAEMFTELLKAMYDSNPEFAARRQAALQRKAERTERERGELVCRPQSIHS